MIYWDVLIFSPGFQLLIMIINLSYFLDLMSSVITLYNVCSVHREMFSTSEGVQYIGGIS